MTPDSDKQERCTCDSHFGSAGCPIHDAPTPDNRAEPCPTCGEYGPEHFDRNAETMEWEARCGDEYHDQFADNRAEGERDYPWLTFNEDGSMRTEMTGATPAEMDRRLVITQEIQAGRLIPLATANREREALTQLVSVAAEYREKAAPHEQLWQAEDYHRFERLSTALAEARAALAGSEDA